MGTLVFFGLLMCPSIFAYLADAYRTRLFLSLAKKYNLIFEKNGFHLVPPQGSVRCRSLSGTLDGYQIEITDQVYSNTLLFPVPGRLVFVPWNFLALKFFTL